MLDGYLIQFDKSNDQILNYYKNSHQAEAVTGLPSKCIRSCAQGYLPHVNGWKFQFAPPRVLNTLNSFLPLTPEFVIGIVKLDLAIIKPTFTTLFQIVIEKMRGNDDYFCATWAGPRKLYKFNKISKNPSITQLMQIKKIVVEAAIAIQRGYRLWIWRKKTVWNPHTYLGELNLRIRTQAFYQQQNKPNPML